MPSRRLILPGSAAEMPRFVKGRVLEPEVMGGDEEVAAYAGGVATAHLDRMDDSFVRAALRLAGPGARILDVGTGTGSLPVKMALKRPDAALVGVDLSDAMLRAARERAATARIGRRVTFRRANARRLPFRRGAFDLVISNSLLHHLPDPVPTLDEIARVLAPGGSVFIRDLRRPARPRLRAHIRRHGRFYKGTMYRLFSDSVKASFKVAEMKLLVAESRLRGCRVRAQLATYLVIEGAPRRRAGPRYLQKRGLRGRVSPRA